MSHGTTATNWRKQDFGLHRQRKSQRRSSSKSSLTAKIDCEPETTTYEEFKQHLWRESNLQLAQQFDKSGFPEVIKRSFLTSVFDQLYDSADDLWEELCLEVKREFERSNRIVDIPLGSVTYYLRKPFDSHISPTLDHNWEYSVDRFSPRFKGIGASPAEAQLDFQNQVHTAFQSLVRLRPFQMTETQTEDWQILSSLIDVDRYWSSVPVKLIEVGVISGITSAGREVVWLDGGKKEIVSREKSEPDFAAFEVGQWFEALVEREPNTYKLREVSYVQTIDPVHEMSDEEFRAWIDRLPSADTLPESDTTWITL